MNINNRLTGQYYVGKNTKLASKSEVMNVITELKTYYETLIELLNETYDRVTDERKNMLIKLNLIYERLLHIEFLLTKFNDEVDVSILEKLQSLMNTFNLDFIQFVEKEDINVFNHSMLENDTDGQELTEFDRSINHIGTDLGFRWFGGKISNSNIINELNNCIRLVKTNNVAGMKIEDYNISNPIIELFIFGPKGMSWLEIGQNAGLGFNVIIKYQSSKNAFNTSIKSEQFLNKKHYEVNNLDLDMILNFSFDENDRNDKDLYIKIKTNIPANSFSGLPQFYISNSNTTNNYNDTISLKSKDKSLLNHNNKDIKFFKDANDTIEDLDSKNIIPIKTNQPINSKTNKFNNDGEILDDEFHFKANINISANNDNSLNISEIVTKNNSADEFNTGININNGIIINGLDGGKFQNENYLDKSDDYNESSDNSPIKYTDKKQIVDLTDYRSLPPSILILKNENVYSLEKTIDKSIKMINNIEEYDEIKNKTVLSTDIVNGEYIENLDDDEYYEKKIFPLNLKINFTINYIKKTSIGTIITSDSGVYLWDDKNLTIITTNLSSGMFGKILELTDGSIFICSLDNNGIYKYDKNSSSNLNTQFIKSNIISGSFSDILLNVNGNSFYAIRNGATSIKNDITGIYSFKNLFYIYNNGSINEYSEYIQTNNLDEGLIQTTSSELAGTLAGGSNYKLDFDPDEERFYIFNLTNGTAFISTYNKLGNFVSYLKNSLIDIVDYKSKFIISTDKIKYERTLPIGPDFKILTILDSRRIIVVNNGCLCYSDDNLISFIKCKNINTGEDVTTSESFTCENCVQMSNGNLLYSIGSYDSYILTSNDNGATWIFSQHKKIKITKHIYKLSDDSILVVGAFGIWKSYNNGETYIEKACGYIEGFELLNDDNMIYIIFDSSTFLISLYYSHDKGDTWIENENLGRCDNTGGSGIYTMRFNNDRVLLSTYGEIYIINSDNSVIKTTFISKSFRYYFIFNSGMILTSVYDYNDEKYYIFKSMDNGETWTGNDTIFPFTIDDNDVRHFFHCGYSNKIFYVSKSNIIYMSNDEGITWEIITIYDKDVLSISNFNIINNILFLTETTSGGYNSNITTKFSKEIVSSQETKDIYETKYKMFNGKSKLISNKNLSYANLI